MHGLYFIIKLLKRTFQVFVKKPMSLWKIVIICISALIVAVLISAGGCYMYWQKRRTVSMEHILPSYQLRGPPFSFDEEAEGI